MVVLMKSKLVNIGLVIIVIAGISLGVGYFTLFGGSNDAGKGSSANETQAGLENECTDVCSNEGEKVQCKEGNSGTMQIPIVGVQFTETDEKHHWDMGPGIGKVVTKLLWTDTSWEFEFSIGTRECPDKGEEKASGRGNNGTIVLEYKEEYLPEEEWFAHIRCIAPENHRGGNCDYTIEVTIFKCCGEH